MPCIQKLKQEQEVPRNLFSRSRTGLGKNAGRAEEKSPAKRGPRSGNNRRKSRRPKWRWLSTKRRSSRRGHLFLQPGRKMKTRVTSLPTRNQSICSVTPNPPNKTEPSTSSPSLPQLSPSSPTTPKMIWFRTAARDPKSTTRSLWLSPPKKWWNTSMESRHKNWLSLN